MTRLDDSTHTLDDTAVAAKKVYLKTFGCQMNVYDSERMMDALVKDGYAPTDEPASADLIVLNTCHIREKAVDKVYSDLGRLRDIKLAREADGHSTLIAVAGCVAQAEGKEITRRAPAVDVVVGPQSYHRLPGLLTRAKIERRGIVETAFLDDEKFSELPSRKARRAAAAFLTIQEGCDKFCSFCVVPYTRGGEFSRAVSTIEKEARSLIEAGVREVTLLGQNVNAFHGEGPDGQVWSLSRLIGLLASIDGLQRIRYTTSHPSDMSDDLIAAHASEPKLMPYLHLPVQSGSDRILSAMNRRHRIADYRKIIDRMRVARPEIALSTDLIVGFPGETDADFGATMALVEEITFAQAYSFKYSSRPGTPAANLPDQIPEDLKTERLLRLQDVLFRQQTAFNTAQIGKTVDVLFDRAGRQEGQWIGRSPYLQSVHTLCEHTLMGTIIPVRIEKATQNSLTGVIAV